MKVLEMIWADRLKRNVRVEDLFTTLNEAIPDLVPSVRGSEKDVRKLSVYLMVALQFASQVQKHICQYIEGQRQKEEKQRD